MHVVELGAHELAQDPAPAVAGQDADDRHAGSVDAPAGNRQLEGEHARAADGVAVLEGRVEASGRHQPVEHRQRVLARGAAEEVEDRAEPARHLLGAARSDLDRQAIFSSGA